MLSESARKDFEGLEPAELGEADSIVVGLAPEAFTYDRLNTAFRLRECPAQSFSAREADLTDPSATAVKKERLSPSSPTPADGMRYLIAAHAGLRFQDEDAALSLGPGPFVQALSLASGVEAEVIGKPTRGFFEMALRTLEADGVREQDWHDVAIVGDDFKNDLSGGATELGLRRFLGQSKQQSIKGLLACRPFRPFIAPVLQSEPASIGPVTRAKATRPTASGTALRRSLTICCLFEPP